MATPRKSWTWRLLAGAAVLAAVPAWGDIGSTGDVLPADPATWDSGTEGHVGETSVGAVTVNLGSVLLSGRGYLGYGAAASGVVVVDGLGSGWNCDGLTVGHSGTGMLTITHGGQVISNYYIFLALNPGSNGTVTVDGSGSTWSSGWVLEVGFGGTGALNIANGGKVNGGYVTLGSSLDGVGVGTVDGSGSMLTCSVDLNVGYSGTGALNITNGGLVAVDGATYIANGNASTGFIHLGPNGGTLTTRSFFGNPAQFTGVGTLNTRGLVKDGELVFDASHGAMQTLAWVSGQENVTVHLEASGNGGVGDLGAGYQGMGTLTISDGVAINSGNGILGYKAGSAGVATVDGSGSTWTCGGELFVGYSGTGTLNITNGGQVSSSYGGIGGDAGSASAVTVDGSGSMWTCYGDLSVGGAGTGALHITRGGLVSSNAGYLGYATDSAGVASVDGSSSTWTCGSALYVGYFGTGTLNIANGGLVTVGGPTYIAYDAASTGTIHFGPNGGTLTTGSLYGGPAQFMGVGTVNTFGLVRDDNLVFDASHGTMQTLSWVSGQENVTVHLDVTGSVGVGDLGVGYHGLGTLTIRDGVAVTSANGILGYNPGSTGVGTVEGSGSTWNCTGDLSVGDSGTGTLTITHGGKVSNANGYLGNNWGSAGVVTVDGSGSTWTSTSEIFVGTYGTGTLNITHGGQVSISSNGFIGVFPESTGVTTVDGSGSTWAFSGELAVGVEGMGTLNIINGGQVSNGTGYLGNNGGSTGVVTVDGSGSTWICSSDLYVGNYGTGALNITNGGQVAVGGTTYVAYDAAATGSIDFGPNDGTLTTGSLYGGVMQFTGVGTVITRGLVTDDNLVFDASHGTMQTLAWVSGQENVTVHLDVTGSVGVGDLGVGYQGAGTLTICDGVAITSRNGILGYNSGSAGMATVNGSGSMWTCGGDLVVGNYGAGTLNITHGGRVNSYSGLLGFTPGSAGVVTVDGSGSTWTCSGDLNVGYLGMGALNITNGGAVSNYGSGVVSQFWGSAGTVAVDGSGSTWTCIGNLTVGNTDTGTLNITRGGKVSVITGDVSYFGNGYLGDNAGSVGVVTVDGSGSTWTSDRDLVVGNRGTGTLTITNGGKVSNDNGYLGQNGGSSGVVTVDGSGSTWTCSGNLNVGYIGTGTLNIANGGKVSNNGWGYLGAVSGSVGMATVDGSGSTWTCDVLIVGSWGTGTLTIIHGGQVSSSSGALGWPGSAGVVTVDGSGSTWTSGSDLNVGSQGTGTIHVTNGGRVSVSNGYLGNNLGSVGMVTVDGSGSTWTCGAGLRVGDFGKGMLMISNGGAVTADSGVMINNISWLALSVGDGSKFSAGTGALINNGVIRLMAAPNATAGAYAPITAGWWMGNGTVTALGGSWSETAYTFTIAAAVNGTMGEAVTLDTLAVQRVVITSPTGDSVRAGFRATVTSASLTFAAAELTDGETALLQGGLPDSVPIFDGWTFATSGYTEGDPVVLSLKVGAGQTAANLAVWHYDGAAWTVFAAEDLTYDGTYASFTVTGFSGYAVTTAVPEAGTLGVLAVGVVGLRRRRRRQLGSPLI